MNPQVVRGLRRREPAIDFREAAGVIADSVSDLEVLLLAARDARILVSRDVTTMPGHFQDFIAEQDSPGLLLIPSDRPIGEIIDGILRIWLTCSDADLRNSIRWLPR